jgi:DnaK suppressor protein
MLDLRTKAAGYEFGRPPAHRGRPISRSSRRLRIPKAQAGRAAIPGCFGTITYCRRGQRGVSCIVPYGVHPILAGGREEYFPMMQNLTPRQATMLEDSLRGQRRRLQDGLREHLLKSDDDRARILADRVGDIEDESVAALIIDLDLSEVDRDVEELRDVEAALERIHGARFGMCASCGDAIPCERLAARPTAMRCNRCQRVHEKTHVHKQTPRL